MTQWHFAQFSLKEIALCVQVKRMSQITIILIRLPLLVALNILHLRQVVNNILREEGARGASVGGENIRRGH